MGGVCDLSDQQVSIYQGHISSRMWYLLSVLPVMAFVYCVCCYYLQRTKSWNKDGSEIVHRSCYCWTCHLTLIETNRASFQPSARRTLGLRGNCSREVETASSVVFTLTELPPSLVVCIIAESAYVPLQTTLAYEAGGGGGGWARGTCPPHFFDWGAMYVCAPPPPHHIFIFHLNYMFI